MTDRDRAWDAEHHRAALQIITEADRGLRVAEHGRYYGQARWFGLRRPIYYWALRRYITAATRRNTGDPTC